MVEEYKISIHAPRTGSDIGSSKPSISSVISIHAPRTGSDLIRRRSGEPAGYFNPRSPHGERHRSASAREVHRAISIHAPRTGSDERLRWRRSREPFQSTLPARGATSIARFWRIINGLFQSTLPARGATAACVRKPSRYLEFQSTLPARGATDHQTAAQRIPHISIHAPRTGSDR